MMTNSNDVMMKQLELLGKAMDQSGSKESNVQQDNYKVGDVRHFVDGILPPDYLPLCYAFASLNYHELNAMYPSGITPNIDITPLVGIYGIKAK